MTKKKHMEEILLEIIKDIQIGVYNNGRKLPKVKKNLVWGQLFKKMDRALEKLIRDGKIEKVDCCSNVSYRIKVK